VRRRVGAEARRLRALSRAIGEIDVQATLAEVAHRRGYVRPEIDGSLALDLVECRHPIVETLSAAARSSRTTSRSTRRPRGCS